ncbi:MAG: alpha-amylase family glycosyl hydrolase, partial [Chitinophagales bacterium]
MKNNGIGFYLLIATMILSKHLFAQQNILFGLATPIELQPDTTRVFLEDYFTDASQVQEIIAPDYFKVQRNADNIITLTTIQNDIPAISKIDFVVNQERFSILVKRSKKKFFTYSLNPQGKNYQQVTITGDFNGWNRTQTPLTFLDGKWQTELVLNPGKYQYLVVADGAEMLDPNNKNSQPNGMGGYNSVFTVEGVDYKAIPFITTQKFNNKNIWLTHENAVDKWFVLWNNISLHYAEADSHAIKITIPPQAVFEKRSHIRVYAYNNAGESNDILIPLEYGEVITDASMLERTDFQRNIMYFVFIDRFMNGDKSNDKKVDDTRVLPRANYYGGDIAGVQQKINEGYFQDLGFNAIWISPVNQNPMGAYQEYPEPRRWFTGYHGYWP